MDQSSEARSDVVPELINHFDDTVLVGTGDRVVDLVSGIVGIATARCEYLNGCVQFEVMPRRDEIGKAVDALWVDDSQLRVVDTNPLDLAVLSGGGVEVRLIFDGLPGPEAPRFVEAEDSEGRGVKVGEWVEDADGRWSLRIRAEVTRLPTVLATAGIERKDYR